MPWPVRVALGLTVALGVSYVLFASTLLLASHVSVRGTSRLSSAEVARVARVPTGVPLARLDTRTLARRVAALPAVAKVDVRRSLPHTVRITVTERVPLLAVPALGGYTLVDSHAVPFATVPTLSKESAPLPLVRLGSVRPNDPTTRAAVSILQALDPGIRARLQRLDAPSPDAVTLVLRDGRRVVWGTADRPGDKAEVLAALLRRKGRVYDISAPTVATVVR